MLARAAVIIVLGFIAYGSMLPSPFRIMDDRASIVENQTIKSLKNIPGIFKEGYFHDQSYYRPLIILSFMGEYQAFGIKSFYYNLDNLTLHIINALLVFILVCRLTNNEAIGFWTGLLFAIHPVQWEAVCNIPGRSILLSAFFDLISFLLFLEFYKNRRWFFLFLVLFTFSLYLEGGHQVEIERSHDRGDDAERRTAHDSQFQHALVMVMREERRAARGCVEPRPQVRHIGGLEAGVGDRLEHRAMRKKPVGGDCPQGLALDRIPRRPDPGAAPC